MFPTKTRFASWLHPRAWIMSVFLPLIIPGVSASPAATPSAIATYESASLYWKNQDKGSCRVQYRPTGTTEWRSALDLIHDAAAGEYRGSLVGLEPDSSYDVRLSAGGGAAEFSFRTRSDWFPIGRTTIVPTGESDAPVIVTESGTPDAYHLVTVPKGARSTINVTNSVPNGIEIDADYVIVRGVEVRNAAHHGILIREGRHDVVVEACRIWHWGRMGGAASFGYNGGNMDSGIMADPATYNLTLQRNLIEKPRGPRTIGRRGIRSGRRASRSGAVSEGTSFVIMKSGQPRIMVSTTASGVARTSRMLVISIAIRIFMETSSAMPGTMPSSAKARI